MPTFNYNIPCFSPPIGYKHKINANAAWIGSNRHFARTTVATGRSLLPPVLGTPGPTTPWGTPLPIWRTGDEVLVQLNSPGGEWLPATILDVLLPLEIESLSMDEIQALPSSHLENIFCRYTVELVEGGTVSNVWTGIEEKFIVPKRLQRLLKANASRFKVGERVLVQTSGGSRRRTHLGHISDIAGDKVVRCKNIWYIVPRLYKVYIDGLDTSGYWAAKSIAKLGSSSDEEGVPLLPPPIPTVSLPSPEAPTVE